MIHWQHQPPATPEDFPGYEKYTGLRGGAAVAEMRVYQETPTERCRQEIYRHGNLIATFHGYGRVSSDCLQSLLFPED